MMRAWRWAAGLAVGIGLALGAQAVASSPQPASVDDFVLPDQDYLARQADENPGPFLALIGKVLPVTLQGGGGDTPGIKLLWVPPKEKDGDGG